MSKETSIVKKYIQLLDDLPETIKRVQIQEKYIYDKLGMSPKTWHNRKTLKNWSPEEVLEVLKIISKLG
jgi:uncharacterized protein (DUF2384 family)